MAINESEAFCFDLCRRAALSMWSYANPLRCDSEEECCDVLVVCDPDVIIFSVKDTRLKDTGDAGVDRDRWRRKAIDDSVKQLYGAERHILAHSAVRAEVPGRGLAEIPLPPKPQICRIAVALGSRGEVPVRYGDFGKGFVHVMDKAGIAVLLDELDTITDLVRYLKCKEQAIGRTQFLISAEEDLLTVYLQHERGFPNGDYIILEDDLWLAFQSSDAYSDKKAADRVSYLWDDIIELVARDLRDGRLLVSPGHEGTELALRVMAKEDRVSRRMLAASLMDVMGRALEGTQCRIRPSPSGTVYVFLVTDRETTREQRRNDLQVRCFVAKHLHSEAPTVIGLATDPPDDGPCSYDICYFSPGEWTEADKQCAEEIRQRFGYFRDVRRLRVTTQEYPGCGPEPPAHDTPQAE